MGAGAKFLAKRPFEGVEKLDVQAYLTTRLQFDSKLEWRWQRHGYWGRPRMGWEGFYTPFSYYGSGNDPAERGKIIYSPLGGKVFIASLYPLVGSWQIRLDGEIQAVEMTHISADGGDSLRQTVLPSTTPGIDGGWQDQGKISLIWDSRDDEDLPARGVFAGMLLGHSSPALDFDYGSYEIFFARYWSWWPSLEGAGKISHRGVTGGAPFYERPALGDRKTLRGIPDRRLRDRQAEAIQTEIRYAFHLALPFIADWFGDTWQVAAFGELGRVEKDIPSVLESRWHPSAGVGGRLLIKERLGAMRGDLGFSGYGFGLYVDFNQAF